MGSFLLHRKIQKYLATRSVRLLIPELAVLAAVDDEVDGAVEDNKKVGDGNRDLKLIINL